MKFQFFGLKRRATADARRVRFQQMIALASETASINPEGLRSLNRLVAASLQARLLSCAAYAAPHHARLADGFSALFFKEGMPVTAEGRQTHEIAARYPEPRYRLKLGVDPVLSTPWHRARLASALATIGFGKQKGAWSEDSNHRVTFLVPIGIGIVKGGNHSIAAGIVNGEGHLTSTDVQDLTPLYAHVRYDGLAFIRIHDGAKLSQPDDEELGILFEIGRLMVEHGVAPRTEN